MSESTDESAADSHPGDADLASHAQRTAEIRRVLPTAITASQ
jgi:hypothetical protein